MKIIPLSEGTFTIDETKEFIPFDSKADNLSDRTKGSLLVEIQPFLVVLRDDIILMDTGLGFSDEQGILQIHNNLSKHGIYPSDITLVLMSHLHKDHAGGIVMKDPFREEYQLSFPQAKHYIQKREYENAMSTLSSSFDKEKLLSMSRHEQIHFLEDDNGFIGTTIQYELTGGHSPFHQAFHLKNNQGYAFFGGDEAPQLQQMKTRFVAKYDKDGKKAMHLRQQWWEEAQSDFRTFLFYHDIKTPTYTFENR